MPDNGLEMTATVSFEKAVEFQLLELNSSFEQMSDFRGGVTGEKVEITDRFGNLKGKRTQGRLSPSELQDLDVLRHFIHKQNRIAVHTALDPDDQMATEVPLDSPLAIAVARAIQVARQDEFLVGFYSDAYTGKEGLTSLAFNAANIIPADHGQAPGTFVGLNLDKLRAVRKRGRKLMIDPAVEKMHMGIDAEDIDDLLIINEYVSRDYNPDSQQQSSKPMSSGQQQALQDGEPTDFLGIHFVPMEFRNSEAYPEGSKLGVNGSGHRRSPIWIPSAMAGREWLSVKTERDKRPDLNHAMQYSAYTNVRYSRRHNDKCFIIESAD